ncbi:unnamed protein product [Linum trigynum]|uniref:Uncharacterized protein n=1 Tax=Linum trigynum TaxID=586398 RepID=A0AAV2EQL4_9ROSI
MEIRGRPAGIFSCSHCQLQPLPGLYMIAFRVLSVRGDTKQLSTRVIPIINIKPLRMSFCRKTGLLSEELPTFRPAREPAKPSWQ